MSGSAGAAPLIASFPAAGAGSTSLAWLTPIAAARGAQHLPLATPSSTAEFHSGRWLDGVVDAVGGAAGRTGADSVVLVGHSMGGLAALLAARALRADFPVGVLGINPPCPDAEGRIPTMSASDDAEIARILGGDGFPVELLDDEELLAEVADGVRADAGVADELAVRVAGMGDVGPLCVLATRGDAFIGVRHCLRWRERCRSGLDLIEADGSHMLTGTPGHILERAVDSVVASVRRDVAWRS